MDAARDTLYVVAQQGSPRAVGPPQQELIPGTLPGNTWDVICPLRIEAVCGSYTQPEAPNESTVEADLGARNDHSYFKTTTAGSKEQNGRSVCDSSESPVTAPKDLDAVFEELVMLSEAAASDTLFSGTSQNETVNYSKREERSSPTAEHVIAEKTDASREIETLEERGPPECADHSYQLGSKKRVITVATRPALTSKDSKMGEKQFLEVEIENEELRGATMREIGCHKAELRKAKARFKKIRGRFDQQKKKLKCLESLLFCERTVERDGKNVIEITLSPLAMEVYETVNLSCKEEEPSEAVGSA